MQEKRAESTREVVVQEPLWPPHPFELGPKHEQGEHVEENVPQTRVHEHVRHHLPRLEIGRTGVVAGQHRTELRRQEMRHHIEDDVDDQQVADDGRGLLEHAGCESAETRFHGFLVKGSEGRTSPRVAVRFLTGKQPVHQIEHLRPGQGPT